MQQKAKPIRWLLFAVSVFIGAWWFGPHVKPLQSSVAPNAEPIWPSNKSVLEVLGDPTQECGIVASYARQKTISSLSSVLSPEIARHAGFSVGNDRALDCNQILQGEESEAAASISGTRLQQFDGISFSRIYRNVDTPDRAFLFADYDCVQLCGHGVAIAFKRISGHWVAIGETVTWEN